MKQDYSDRAFRNRIEAKMAERMIDWAMADDGPLPVIVAQRHGGLYMTYRELAFYLGLGKLTEAQLQALERLWPTIAADWRGRAAAA